MTQNKPKKQHSSLVRLAVMMRPFMKYLYFVFFCVLVSNLGVLIKPFIVKTIIDSHGENISVTSQQGVTEFTFTLPFVN